MEVTPRPATPVRTPRATQTARFLFPRRRSPIPLCAMSPATRALGLLAASVALGIAGPQCASYGGVVVKDEPGQFKAKNAPAAGRCP